MMTIPELQWLFRTKSYRLFCKEVTVMTVIWDMEARRRAEGEYQGGYDEAVKPMMGD